jgi:hypothetical protein
MRLKPLLLLAVACATLATGAHAAVNAKVLCAFTTRAANMNGGSANLQSIINGVISTCNQVHVNAKTDVSWTKVGWHQAYGLADSKPGGEILDALAAGGGGCKTKARELGANLIMCLADTTDVGGVAYQPGQYSIVDAAWPGDWGLTSHEIGHNYNAAHEHGMCWTYNGANYRTVMQHNYCGGTTIKYYTNPAIYTSGKTIGNSTHNNRQRIYDKRGVRVYTTF